MTESTFRLYLLPLQRGLTRVLLIHALMWRGRGDVMLADPSLSRNGSTVVGDQQAQYYHQPSIQKAFTVTSDWCMTQKPSLTLPRQLLRPTADAKLKIIYRQTEKTHDWHDRIAYCVRNWSYKTGSQSCVHPSPMAWRKSRKSRSVMKVTSRLDYVWRFCVQRGDQNSKQHHAFINM